ncbi:glycosyltransferase family 2 protein [Paenibacillus peoriae]|uniref:glycosyltransferase family 2 protein n=1 Tax=Paenibacillus peoriae TaxID=59893 RepID=UPI0002F1206A|nr:glycosyltransferase family 2 protein [Paenibacillus peoriae]MEC0183423.1 glycosyltransferase family 2 protein [Paenibacillus peoriae]
MNNQDTPLVSVIVPSYNYEKYIEAALKSIYEQTYDQLELVVIDDNSKDNSCHIINELISSEIYLERFKNRLKFLSHDQNQGAHNSINEGIRASQGKYVTILNADDLFEPNRITQLVKHLSASNSDFVFSRIKVIDGEGNDISTVSDQAINFINTQNSIEKFPSIGWSLIPHNTAISTGNMLFSREIFDKLNGFRNLKYCHDWDFALRCLLLSEPLFVESTYYYYRLHGSNTFLTLNDVVDKEVKTVLGSYFKSCRKKNVLNKLAPSPQNWSEQFFEILKDSSIINYWYYSRTIANFFLQLRQNQIDYKDTK